MGPQLHAQPLHSLAQPRDVAVHAILIEDQAGGANGPERLSARIGGISCLFIQQGWFRFTLKGA